MTDTERGDAARLDALDSTLTLVLIAAECGPRGGRLSEGCVQLRIETVREIQEAIRSMRPPPRKLDPYRDCTCTVVRNPNRDSFARREHNPRCVYHAALTPDKEPSR